ncbi:hypothetical protein E2562_001864 [Oryza meyeriana var. granulata]|uniref:DUF834 domain-containing protein n=1 Tax=Oryza meyeriana var. granulata TaxID=110450 RepID=A0A6G1C309_9ORYZ|nr:hypothetical protein E2562_001864 [Oryza meyeriana var. granulata]
MAATKRRFGEEERGIRDMSEGVLRGCLHRERERGKLIVVGMEEGSSNVGGISKCKVVEEMRDGMGGGEEMEGGREAEAMVEDSGESS